MAEVRIHNRTDLQWDQMRDLYPAEMAAEMCQPELDSTMCTHESGTDGSLHLQELKFLEGAKASLHAHDRSEIIYVIEGNLQFGDRVLEAGSSVYIEKETLYDFEGGKGGARILVFMADGRVQYFTKDTLVENKKQQAAAAEVN